MSAICSACSSVVSGSLIALCMLLASLSASAQCGTTGIAFRSGETLSYDLYFNWKFVWLKVGSATWNVTSSTYGGKPAYRTRLVTRTAAKYDRYFTMRDTLISYVSQSDLTPLFYSKHAFEGGTLRQEDVRYTYPGGKCHVSMTYRRDGGALQRASATVSCAYDMLSMMLRSRSFSTASWKKGHRVNFNLVEGNKCQQRTFCYIGEKNFTVEGTGKTYRCLVFSYLEREDGKKEKEIVKFYITNDKAHLPVRLDLNLRFGTAKAYLTAARGTR